MIDLTPAALAVFRQCHGNATAAMLSRAGVGARRRRRLLEAGILVTPYKGVYRIGSAPDTLEARAAALCMAYPAGFITGPTAGQLRGLRRMGRPGELHFSIHHGSNIGPIDGVRLRQTTIVDTSHVERRPDGITLARPARLAFDLAADLSDLDHASVVEQLLHEKTCTPVALRRIGERLAHPARPGSLRFMATLAQRVDGGALESHLEVELARALRARGVPVVAQVDWLKLPDGRRIRIDLAVPEIRWAIEIDGHSEHFLLEGATRDRRRDRQCHLIGWQVERVTPLDLSDLPSLCDELVTLYEARCRAVA